MLEQKNPSKYSHLIHINMYVHKFILDGWRARLCNIIKLNFSFIGHIVHHKGYEKSQDGIPYSLEFSEHRVSPVFWLPWLQRSNALGVDAVDKGQILVIWEAC